MTPAHMLIGRRWQPARSARIEDVVSPFDGSVVGSVPIAGLAEVDAALTAAELGAARWRRTPAHERARRGRLDLYPAQQSGRDVAEAKVWLRSCARGG